MPAKIVILINPARERDCEAMAFPNAAPRSLPRADRRKPRPVSKALPALGLRAMSSALRHGFDRAYVDFELPAQAKEDEPHRFAGRPLRQESIDVIHRGHFAILDPDE